MKTNSPLSSYRPKLSTAAVQHKRLQLTSTNASADIFRLVLSREFAKGYYRPLTEAAPILSKHSLQ